MADFCKQCSIEIFENDYGDFAGLCKKEETIEVLCEGCGEYIIVNSDGERIIGQIKK